jgi:outer membrane protein assembly factor BamE
MIPVLPASNRLTLVPLALHTNSSGVAGRTARLAAVAIIAATLAACGSVDRTGRAFWQPYRPNVQQGNWVTQQQIALLRPGMTREQVRFALGTPTLTPVFHSDRWEYPYYLKPGYGDTQERRFTVFFENDVLVRWEGDEQPRVQPFQDPDQASEQNLPQQAPLTGSAPGAMPEQDATSQDAEERAEQETVNTGNRVIQLNRTGSPGAQGGVNPTTGSVPLR